MDQKRQSRLLPGLKMLCSRLALGRVFLHTGCLCRGGKPGFHIAGIRRELRQIARFGVRRP